MTAFDKNKVVAFCRKNFLEELDASGLFYLFAFIEGGQPVPVRTLHHHRDFANLTPWEQANVVYELSDYVNTRLKLLQKRYSQAARVADDIEEKAHAQEARAQAGTQAAQDQEERTSSGVQPSEGARGSAG